MTPTSAQSASSRGALHSGHAQKLIDLGCAVIHTDEPWRRWRWDLEKAQAAKAFNWCNSQPAHQGTTRINGAYWRAELLGEGPWKPALLVVWADLHLPGRARPVTSVSELKQGYDAGHLLKDMVYQGLPQWPAVLQVRKALGQLGVPHDVASQSTWPGGVHEYDGGWVDENSIVYLCSECGLGSEVLDELTFSGRLDTELRRQGLVFDYIESLNPALAVVLRSPGYA